MAPAGSRAFGTRQDDALPPVLDMLRLPEVHEHDRAFLQAGTRGCGSDFHVVGACVGIALDRDRADGAAFCGDGRVVGHQSILHGEHFAFSGRNSNREPLTTRW